MTETKGMNGKTGSGFADATCSAIDTADTVLHKPTGERWVVACVSGKHLSWCGWPEGMAELSDCELVEKATPEARDELLAKLAAMQDEHGRRDHRKSYAMHRLSPNSAIGQPDAIKGL